MRRFVSAAGIRTELFLGIFVCLTLLGTTSMAEPIYSQADNVDLIVSKAVLNPFTLQMFRPNAKPERVVVLQDIFSSIQAPKNVSHNKYELTSTTGSTTTIQLRNRTILTPYKPSLRDDYKP
ncbi:hypothetical protein ACFL3F_05050 [Planctomycetota bacterium]